MEETCPGDTSKVTTVYEYTRNESAALAPSTLNSTHVMIYNTKL